ncbi:TIGR03089 family protein [Cellulomonas sp. SLBN-39]|uniref:TIGR03089 family protein n=1 Tax=Cellulomonas sp. SLBN-39 TaxID=2768446 RepID=UPI00116B5799|nr:TIGR03089 family protein [Cellulomonas sp. SLBN-39]TQL03689.1 uncharacterized protein (TIGR03089 family) [Cellulomonas sp. SLBN-39]
MLATLQKEPGRPRLTWYGHDGERVELSGAVVVNWVTKTTNLLVEEYDVGPGSEVLLDLPLHWRTVLWALATWRAGACVLAPDAGGSRRSADVVVTADVARHVDAPALVAVALPALARRVDSPLPAGATDGAAAVMTYPDQLGPVPRPDPGAPALDGVTHGDLLARAHGTTTATGVRRLEAAGTDPVTATALLGVLGLLSGGGSLVLVDAATAQALRTDEARRARLVTSEIVTEDALDGDPAGPARSSTAPLDR